MTVEQIVEIPANRRLTIEVPREVPVGRTILSFTPVAGQVSADTVAEASPPYAEDGLNEDGLYPDGVCPICAVHIDPETGNPRYNAETVAAIEEGIAISNGEIPVKWHKPHEFEKVWQDLLSGEDADESVDSLSPDD